MSALASSLGSVAPLVGASVLIFGAYLSGSVAEIPDSIAKRLGTHLRPSEQAVFGDVSIDRSLPALERFPVEERNKAFFRFGSEERETHER